MACGEHHTVALAAGGKVLSCGRYAYGRLGRTTVGPRIRIQGAGAAVVY